MSGSPGTRRTGHRATRRLSDPPAVPPLPPAHGNFEFGVFSEKNYPFRRTMEDAHCFAYDFGGIENQGLFAVFDGHGGKTAAKWAASHLSPNLASALEESPDGDAMETMALVFKRTDDQMTAENGIHSGCTAVVCFLRREQTSTQMTNVLYCANAGDARAVLFRHKKALRLSQDHKASDPLEQRRIRSAGGFVTNDRVNGILAVARSLGDHEMKEYVIGEPHVSRTLLNMEGEEVEDTILVLACDGVWDVLTDQQVCELADGFVDPHEAARVITEKAMEAGSTDNISVIVVYLQRRRPVVVETPNEESPHDQS